MVVIIFNHRLQVKMYIENTRVKLKNLSSKNIYRKTIISIFTLYVTGLNTPIKRQRYDKNWKLNYTANPFKYKNIN